MLIGSCGSIILYVQTLDILVYNLGWRQNGRSFCIKRNKKKQKIQQRHKKTDETHPQEWAQGLQACWWPFSLVLVLFYETILQRLPLWNGFKTHNWPEWVVFAVCLSFVLFQLSSLSTHAGNWSNGYFRMHLTASPNSPSQHRNTTRIKQKSTSIYC